jgi:glycosyltransferase involved in cell wall biosynthesis
LDEEMISVTFLMEQHIGHRTFAENLQRFMRDAADIEATWEPITYEVLGGFWERLFFLPRHWQGTMRGRQQTRTALRRSSADLAVFNTQVPAALAGRVLGRRPYVLFTDITPIQYDRMAEHYQHTPDKEGWLSQYKKRQNERLFQGAVHCLPWSSWAGASLEKDYGVSPEQITVLPPGVDLTAWTPQYELHDGPLRILFVGGDFYRKGGGLLREAFAHLPAGTAELHLVTRERLAGGENIYVYNDMQPNSDPLIALYQQADIFVLPTQAEAFGIAAVEASGMGLPVLGTAVGGLIDVVADNETGFLLPPGDVHALVERLRLLAAEPERRVQMGKAARARVEERFDARKNAARLAQLIRKLVG